MRTVFDAVPLAPGVWGALVAAIAATAATIHVGLRYMQRGSGTDTIASFKA